MVTVTQNRFSEYKIMIVGGGPAGISTWLHLHKYDPDLASKAFLIEKAKYPRDKLCGGAVGTWGQDILRDLGIQLDIPSVSINNTEYRFGKEVFCNREPGFLKIFRRIEFDYALAKKAVKRGLMLKQGEALLEISHRNKDVLVKTNKREYLVKVLVGADGARSVTRRNMKLKIKPRFAPAIEVFSSVNPQYDTEFEEDTAVLDFSPMTEGLQGYVWHFPCINDGKPWMNYGIYDSRVVRRKPQANLKKILCYKLQSRNINCSTVTWTGHPIPWFDEETALSEPNILLVGDAAGIEPLLGGGIHLALSYGDVAALSIIEAFNSNDFSFATYNNNLQNHAVGKYIKKLTYLAREVYSGKMNILDAIRKVLKK